MLSLISTLGGLLISGLPKLLEFFQSKNDQKHELEVLALQMQRDIELAKQGHVASIRTEEIRAEQAALSFETQMTVGAQHHDETVINKASKWVVNYIGTVRPTITYILVLELVAVNAWIAWFGWTHSSMMTTMDEFIKFTEVIFSDDEMAMLGGIIGFWFGSRNWQKKA